MSEIKEIELNERFKEALELIESGENVFITGKAGTGKSTLLSYFTNHTKKRVVVLAPTGVAALNVKGQTIHSFFHFKPDITINKVRQNYKNKDKKGLMKKNRAQKDILYVSISSFVLVVLWIGFNVYHAYVTSTIAPDLQLIIQPINPKFNLETIQELKKRTKIEPLYELNGASSEAETINSTNSGDLAQ